MKKHLLVTYAWSINNIGDMGIQAGLMTLLREKCPGLPVKLMSYLPENDECYRHYRDVLPEGMSIIPLPGHFFDMVGFRTSDDVVYLADCLSSKETLDKYGVTFIYDVEAYLKTLETVKTLECALFVPSHATATEDITELADYNIAKVQEVADAILSICSEPSQSERVIQCIFDRYSLTMTMQQYVLVGSTVRSYLSWLKDKGELIAEIAGNKLMWKRV